MTRVDTEAHLGTVRHPINEQKLTEYLVSKCPQDFEAPLELKQFGHGQSNPSYQIKDGKGRKYVLRKQPPGKLVSKTAHRVDREYIMIKALYNTGKVPVPRVLDLCQDKDVIGTDFYIMDFVQGRIFIDPAFPGLDAKSRRECWESAITSLANLHAIDPRAIGLPTAFTRNLSSHYPRQLISLGKVAEAQAQVVNTTTGEKVGPIPHFKEICDWMAKHTPPERVSIVHGDYKIDNLIFHPTENRVIAMLDWELCTIGHPLADLGNILQPYSIPIALRQSNQLSALGSSNFDPAQTPGLMELDQVLDLYKKHAGWDPKPDWTFAVVHSHYRLSVIVHGIKARVATGQASSAHAEKHALAVPLFAGLAWQEIEQSEEQNKNKSKL